MRANQIVRPPWQVTLAIVIVFGAMATILYFVPSPVSAAITAAAGFVSAFALVFLTLALAHIEQRRDEAVERRETARLRIIAGVWEAERVDVFVVNDGWKPSAVEFAWLHFCGPEGGRVSFQLNIARVIDGSPIGEIGMIDPGDRCRLRGQPLGYRADAVPASHSEIIVEIIPVIGERAEASLTRFGFPRE